LEHERGEVLGPNRDSKWDCTPDWWETNGKLLEEGENQGHIVQITRANYGEIENQKRKGRRNSGGSPRKKDLETTQLRGKEKIFWGSNFVNFDVKFIPK